MKIKINAQIIRALNPCQPILDNYLKYNSDFNGDIQDFLDLPKLSPICKLWISVQLMPRFLSEIFVIDCAMSAENYRTHYADESARFYFNDYAVSASLAAESCMVSSDIRTNVTNAALCAYKAACFVNLGGLELENQIKIIKYLIDSVVYEK